MNEPLKKIDKLQKVFESTEFEAEKQACLITAKKILQKNGISSTEYTKHYNSKQGEK